MKRAVLSLKGANSPATTLFCLSNSNTVYIDVILKHHKLTDLFTRVTTNPSYWTEDDKLIISRRVAPDAKQHGCKVGCSENMCKGKSRSDDSYLDKFALLRDPLPKMVA